MYDHEIVAKTVREWHAAVTAGTTVEIIASGDTMARILLAISCEKDQYLAAPPPPKVSLKERFLYCFKRKILDRWPKTQTIQIIVTKQAIARKHTLEYSTHYALILAIRRYIRDDVLINASLSVITFVQHDGSTHSVPTPESVQEFLVTDTPSPIAFLLTLPKGIIAEPEAWP